MVLGAMVLRRNLVQFLIIFSKEPFFSPKYPIVHTKFIFENNRRISMVGSSKSDAFAFLLEQKKGFN